MCLSGVIVATAAQPKSHGITLAAVAGMLQYPCEACTRDTSGFEKSQHHLLTICGDFCDKYHGDRVTPLYSNKAAVPLSIARNSCGASLTCGLV